MYLLLAQLTFFQSGVMYIENYVDVYLHSYFSEGSYFLKVSNISNYILTYILSTY